MNGRRTGLWSIVAALAVGVVVGAAAPLYALELSVQGRAGLELEVRAAGTMLVVDGRLHDELGDPLPSRVVDIEIRRQGQVQLRNSVYTDYFGEFSSSVELPPGRYEVEAIYDGAPHVAGASEGEFVDVETAPTMLDLNAPSWVHGADAEVPVRIEATAEGKGLAGAATLSIDGADVAAVSLDRRGRANYDVGPHLRQGNNELVVEIPGGDHRDSVRIARSIRRVDEPRVEGGVDRLFRRMRRGVEVGVDVADSEGPLAGAVVEFRLQNSEVSTDEDATRIEELVNVARTEADGRASALFTDDELGRMSWDVGARIQPPAGAPIDWTGGSVRNEPSRWRGVLSLLAFVVLLAGGLWLGRRGVLVLWEKFNQWRWPTPEKSPDGGDDEVAAVMAKTERVAVHPAPPAASGDDDETDQLRLQLWDEWRDAPVEQAKVVLKGPQEMEQCVDATDGVVELPQLDDGTWDLHCEAPGFVPAHGEVTIPCEPAWVRIKMTAVPLKIRRAYRWMMRRTRGEDAWGRLTPRQIREALTSIESLAGKSGDNTSAEEMQWRSLLGAWEDREPSERPGLLLDMITAVVEETNYSGQVYDATVWEAVREAIVALVDSLEDTALEEERR